MSWARIAAPVARATVALDSADSDWVKAHGDSGGEMLVMGSTGRLEAGPADLMIYRYTGTDSPTGDQLIRANVHTGTSTEEHFQLMVRVGSTGSGYVATWRPVLGVVRLYRVAVGVSVSATLLETATATVLVSTTYLMTLKVTGTNPCVLTLSDNVNGELISYDDSNASRATSGYPGLYFNAANNLTGDTSPAWVDNLQIEDWSSGAGVLVYGNNFDSVGWNKLSPP